MSSIFVYALLNGVNSEIYVGISNDPHRRLKEHNSGKNRYTKAFMPWKIFYQEEFSSYSEARIREKCLKGTTGKRFLRTQKAEWIAQQSKEG